MDQRDDSPTAQRAAPWDCAVSDKSEDRLLNFKREPGSQIHLTPVPSFSPIRQSNPIKTLNITSERVEQQRSEVSSDQQQLESIFKLLEKSILTFAKKELKKLHKVLVSDYPESLELLKDEDEEQISRQAFLKISLDFLKRMDQELLAERLWNRSNSAMCRSKLMSSLQQRFSCVFESIAKAGNPSLLNQIYTELYITEGEASGVNQEHEVRHIENFSRRPATEENTITCEDIFKGLIHRQGLMKAEGIEVKKPIRTELTQGPIRVVLTKGVAGIGKTVLTQKFSLDWAEGKANQDIQLLFPFTFRELNVLRDRQFSLVGLLQHFFSESKGLCSFEDLPVVFIFDGLDECRLPLDFVQTQDLTDPTESSSLDMLLVNLIRGSLLPSARLWITTRPATANQIPAECVSMVTEVRGFTDPQKEQYFRKRFRDEEQATAVISHIKTSQTLYIMCHIPVFCWILSTVLQHVMETKTTDQLPQTLTQMYIHFLVVQAKVKSLKYNGRSVTDPQWSPETRKIVASLGKLAFEQLQKGNLIFYESDLRQCGLEPTEASVYSGVFTQVFREEPGLYQDKVYCFIHLSVQEFLAALHVHQTFFNSGVNLLENNQPASLITKLFKINSNLLQFHQSAVNQALQSTNGHLDLFLRFLLGLSLATNQSLLQGLLTQTGNEQTNQKTVKYIHNKLSEDVCAERSITLLHCLNELNDCSLVQQIQQYLRSGGLSEGGLSPAQWSALAFILLSSEKHLDLFELNKYRASDEALVRLLPVVKASNKALLNRCELSERSCGALSSVLSSCSLRVLDLSNNPLKDSGVELLCVGLKSPHCRLELLKLSHCLVSEDGCVSLASALTSNPSHLRALDLSYNHPGDRGAQLLSALQEDPHFTLESVRLTPAGLQWLRPLSLYFCQLTLDTNTAHRLLQVSDNYKTVRYVREEQPYPDHQDRFEMYKQLLCSTGLTERCYWEVQWDGWVSISVSYREIRRKGDQYDCVFGRNNHSWSLFCSKNGYCIWHNNKQTPLSHPSSSSGTVAVYVDVSGGFLSFYTVSSGELKHLHTFKTTFTEPLYPGFVLWTKNS